MIRCSRNSMPIYYYSSKIENIRCWWSRRGGREHTQTENGENDSTATLKHEGRKEVKLTRVHYRFVTNLPPSNSPGGKLPMIYKKLLKPWKSISVKWNNHLSWHVIEKNSENEKINIMLRCPGLRHHVTEIFSDSRYRWCRISFSLKYFQWVL